VRVSGIDDSWRQTNSGVQQIHGVKPGGNQGSPYPMQWPSCQCDNKQSSLRQLKSKAGISYVRVSLLPFLLSVVEYNDQGGGVNKGKDATTISRNALIAAVGTPGGRCI
jgi:hypothetical protein